MAGRGFSRADNFRLGVRDPIGELRGQRRDPGQASEEVQHGAFGNQDRSRASFHDRNHVIAGRELVAILPYEARAWWLAIDQL